MVELSGVTKSYGDERVLGPLDLGIARGQTTALIGPSGAGKSTILRLVLGLIPATSGEISFDGQPLGALPIEDVRRRIGYVIQDGGLFPHLTAGDNVTLMPRHLGWSVDARRERLASLCELVRLPPSLLERFPSELSGGQRQRISLLRALILDPALLLLDEPLGALDPMIRQELQTDLCAVFEQLGKTVLLVTHDLAEAAYFAQTIVLLDDGRVVQQGPYRELVRSPATPFVTRFIQAQRGIPEA